MQVPQLFSSSLNGLNLTKLNQNGASHINNSSNYTNLSSSLKGSDMAESPNNIDGSKAGQVHNNNFLFDF